jgi:hypothetical protein
VVTLSKNGGSFVDAVNDSDTSITNEIQTLSITGNQLALSKNGGTVTLPTSTSGDNWGLQVVRTDGSLNGEGTMALPLSVDNNVINPLWGNIQNVPPGFADGTDNINYADTSSTNELQTLSISGTQLTLSQGGGTVTLPSAGGGDNWGTQTIVADAPLAGKGITSDPLRISDNGITSAKIKDGTIVSSDISNDAINSSKIQDASVGTTDLAGNAVTTGKIDDNAVTVAKLPAGAASDKYLRGDGTWANPSVGSFQETDPTWHGVANETGDIGRLGDVGIGTVSPTALLHTYGSGTGQGNVVFEGSYKTNFPGKPPVSGSGTRMMWFPDKAAFRVGGVSDTRWDDAYIGSFSNAMGYNATALGNVSLAFGSYTTASNTCSVAIGYCAVSSGAFATSLGNNTTASGYGSTAIGDHTVTASYLSTAMGRYNVGGGTANSWVSTDPLFEIGSGSSSISTSNALTILKNGNTGIGTATPAYKLDVDGTVNLNNGVTSGIALRCNGDEALWSNDTYFSWGYGAGYNYFAKPVSIGTSATPFYTLVVNGTAAKTGGGSWSTLSDARLKDIHGNYNRGLEDIVKIQPVRFTYQKGNPRQLESDKVQIGFVAQDIQPFFPEAVTEAKDGYLDFNMHAINVAVVNAIKELKTENDRQKIQIESLEYRLSKLEEMLENTSVK